MVEEMGHDLAKGVNHWLNGTRPKEAFKWGEEYRNDDHLLPQQDAYGQPISYSEHDLPRGPLDFGKRGDRRIVTGDSKAYFTWDHYHHFLRIY